MKFAFFFPLEFHVMVIPGHLHEHFFFYIPGLTTHKKFFRKYGLINQVLKLIQTQNVARAEAINY